MKLALFRSVKFNIGLFLAIVLAAAAGTLLPQLPENPEKVELFLRGNPFWGGIFETAGLFNVYQSRWFIALLALMAFDIVVCKLGKTPPDSGLVSLPPEMHKDALEETLATMEAAVRRRPLVAEFTVAASPAEAAAGIQRFAARAGFHLHPALGEPAGRSALIATRHRLQRWGSYIAHVSLVVILMGGLVKQLFGFVEMVPVLEGRSKEVLNKPGWELFVDKFTVEYYDGTLEPKLFASRIRVQDRGRLLAEKRITVNDPLDVHGTRFYQASWGAGGMFRDVVLTVGGTALTVPQRKPVAIPGTPIRVTADVLMPNFAVTQDRRADTQSLDLKNPAVRFHFDFGKHRSRSIWLFQFQPDLAFLEDEEGMLHHAPAPPFHLAAVDPILFSGIQVAYDPGFPLVAGGSVAWLVGMVLLFYLHRRRLWILVGPTGPAEVGDPWGGRATRVLIGAWSSRGPVGFQGEFDSIIDKLKTSLDRRSGGTLEPGGRAVASASSGLVSEVIDGGARRKDAAGGAAGGVPSAAVAGGDKKSEMTFDADLEVEP